MFFHTLTTTAATVMNTTTNDIISVYITNTSVVNSESFFGYFRVTTVGSSDLTIRIIVPPDISAEPNRKAMIAILFFVVFFLSLPLFPSLLVIWLQLLHHTSHSLQVRKNARWNTSLTRSVTLSSTLIIFKASGSSIPLVNSR